MLRPQFIIHVLCGCKLFCILLTLDADSSYERRTSFNAKLRIYIGDLTEMGTDAVVCSTQTDLRLPPVGCEYALFIQ